jgi:mannosyltransferase
MAGCGALLALLGREMFTPKVGFIAGLLFALIPSVTRFGQEARMYAPLLLAVVASTYALLVAWRRGTWWRWGLYGLSVAAVGALHPLAVLVLTVHVVAVALLAWREVASPRTWRRLLARAWPAVLACGVGLLLCSPLLWWGFGQREQVSWNITPRLLVVTGLSGDLLGAPIVGGFVLALALWGVLQGWSRPWSAMLVTWCVAGPAVLYLLSRSTPIWNTRYILFVVPGVVLLAAVTLAHLSWGRVALFGVVLGLLAAPAQLDLRRVPSHAQMNGPAIAALMAPLAREGDGYTYVTHEVWAGRDTVRYYVRPELAEGVTTPDVFAIRGTDEGGTFIPKDCRVLALCQRLAQPYERIWLVRWGKHSAAPLLGVDEPKATVLRDEFRVDATWELNNMTVVLLLRR